MNKRKLFLAAALLAVAVVGWAAYSLNPYTTGETAGTAVSGRYEGRYLTFVESALTHPTHSDGFVDKGDPVLVGTRGIVGVALESATAATDYVAIDTEGIWNLSITNIADTTMSAGDPVFIDDDAATLSNSPNDSIFLGTVLSAISTSGSAVVRAVKIHPMIGSSYCAALMIGSSGTKIYQDIITSGTIAAGASSVTLTLPTGYDQTNWRLQYSIVPGIEGNSYAGYGDSYLTWEGGTAAEVRISSETFINLVAEVEAKRLW